MKRFTLLTLVLASFGFGTVVLAAKPEPPPAGPAEIAFTSYRNGPVEAWVYAFHFQAGDRCPIDWTQQLTNTFDLAEFGVAWSPDGTKLATLVSAEEYPENLNPHVLRIHNLIEGGTGESSSIRRVLPQTIFSTTRWISRCRIATPGARCSGLG